MDGWNHQGMKPMVDFWWFIALEHGRFSSEFPDRLRLQPYQPYSITFGHSRIFPKMFSVHHLDVSGRRRADLGGASPSNTPIRVSRATCWAVDSSRRGYPWTLRVSRKIIPSPEPSSPEWSLTNAHELTVSHSPMGAPAFWQGKLPHTWFNMCTKGIHDQSLLGTSKDWTALHPSIHLGHVYEKCTNMLVIVGCSEWKVPYWVLSFLHVRSTLWWLLACMYKMYHVRLSLGYVVMCAFKFMIVVRFVEPDVPHYWVSSFVCWHSTLLFWRLLWTKCTRTWVLSLLCVRSTLWWLLITLKKRYHIVVFLLCDLLFLCPKCTMLTFNFLIVAEIEADIKIGFYHCWVKQMPPKAGFWSEPSIHATLCQ